MGLECNKKFGPSLLNLIGLERRPGIHEVRMPTLHDDSARVNVHAILTSAGFEIASGGKRATCPYCTGHSKLTVAIRGPLWHCHRCLRGGHVGALAKQQGWILPRPRIRQADTPKSAFRYWLSAKMTEMSAAEYKLVRQWRYGIAALEFFPDMEPAWTALANYYDREQYFLVFWESVSDRTGRYWLYRNWRKYGSR